MYSDYFKYLEKIKGDIFPFPNSAWPTEADVPLGVVVNDGGVIKQSRYVGNFDGSDSLDFDFKLGATDFDLEIKGFVFGGVQTGGLFSQYIGGDAGRFLIVLGVDGDMFIQIGDQSKSFSIRKIIIGEYIKSIKINRVGAILTVNIDGSIESTNAVTNPITQATVLTFGEYSGSNKLTAEVGVLVTEGETYNLNQETGSTFTGSEGGVATLTDGIPEDFHKKTLVPV